MKSKKIKKILIDGSFFCRNLTGIERFANEVCINLDDIAKKNEISILIPSNADFTKIPTFKNIEIIKAKARCKSFPLWTHFTFASFSKKTKALPLNFANTTPLFAHGIVFLHDIYAKLYKEDFTSIKDKLVRLYDCLMYFNSAKFSKN